MSETNNKDYDVTSLKLKGPIEMEKELPFLLVESMPRTTENMFLSVETIDEKYQVYLFSCVSWTPGSFTDPLSNKLIGMFGKANDNKVKIICSNFYTDLLNPHKGTNDFINTVYRKALFCSS